jgi:L-rhamnose-proton symport protein (RhaT)
MIEPSLPLGVGFHAAGALLSANCYAPQKYVKRWSWEIFWMTQAAWCLLLWPMVGAIATIPHLTLVLSEGPKDRMLLSFALGLAYGIGGTAFNVSIRYIGFSLTYAIAVGLSSVLGTIVPPLVRGELAAILARAGAPWVILGVIAGAIGIALCGAAGRFKELDLQQSAAPQGEFRSAPACCSRCLLECSRPCMDFRWKWPRRWRTLPRSMVPASGGATSRTCSRTRGRSYRRWRTPYIWDARTAHSTNCATSVPYRAARP